jgi:uncharacterized protein (TIGR04255 family)
MKYDKSPLIEVVFEISFNAANKWNDVIPGLFYSKIEKRFPKISPRINNIGITNNSLQVAKSVNTTLYKNEEENTIVQLSNNIFSVNKLPNYEGWDKFISDIDYAYKSFREIIELHLSPIQVNRIGLRYINKIDIEKHSVSNLKNYLNIYPNLPAYIDSINAIQIALESQHQKEGINKNILSINIATLKQDAQYKAPILFEIDYLNQFNVDLSKYKEWLIDSHEEIDNVFDLSLTEMSKRKLGRNE